MHNNTVCICLAFLHCGFSNVSLNFLPEMMHNHTGCICLAFLHCAFSNVSSNCLPERMQNHTGCICLTFLRCVFQMLSKIAMLWTSIVTLVAIICLFSTTFLKCILKSPASKDVNGCNCLVFHHCVFSNAVSKFILFPHIPQELFLFLPLEFAPQAVLPSVGLCWIFKWCQKKHNTKGYDLKYISRVKMPARF